MSLFNNAIIGAAGQQGYKISRSVRLRSSASAYFNRTPASAGSQTTWTKSLWVKRGALGVRQFITMSGVNPNTTQVWQVEFNANNKLEFYNQTIGTYRLSTQVFRDTSAWYHIVFSADTTNAVAQNRFRCWVNNVEITAWDTNSTIALNYTFAYNGAYLHGIGAYTYSLSNYLDGYLAEINFIDGQALTPSSFGETNSVTGVWQPKKYGGTYGTNGFYLNFSDNSNNTAATIGKDNSGNGNNWTPNNISVTAGVTYDSMIDVPTLYADGGNGRGNYATLHPLAKGPQFTVTDGNLRTGNATVGNYHQTIGSTIAVNTGKWYWEIASNGTIYNSRSLGIAFAGDLTTAGDNPMWNTTTQLKNYRAILLANSTTVTPVRSIAGTVTTATNITLPVTLTGSNTFMVAMDISAGAIWFGVDGTWLKSATTAEIIAGTTTNAVYTDIGSPSDSWTSALYNYLGASTGYGWIANFGQRPFAYTPPTGFVALNTQNLPTPTISNGAAYMDVKLWTGNGTSQTITGLGFEPDLAWIKARSTTYQHSVYDAVRTTSAGRLATDQTLAETSNGANDPSFTSDGITVRSVLNDNGSGQTFVGWMWDAGTSTVTNTSGSISAQVRANPTAGFSVVTYTGNGVTAATVGHGLNAIPAMVIIKERGLAGTNWMVKHQNLATNINLILQTTGGNTNVTTALGGGGIANLSSSTTFNFVAGTTNTDNVNRSAGTFVAYCFAEVAGYSKFGSYTGNGSADGVFVHLGFRARYLLIKETGNANSWEVYDTARNSANVQTQRLFPNDSQAEVTTNPSLDIVSNGFKCRAANTGINRSGGTYIYAAFAENPFKNSLAR